RLLAHTVQQWRTLLLPVDVADFAEVLVLEAVIEAAGAHVVVDAVADAAVVAARKTRRNGCQ
ncbi:hypothetical protein P5F04_15965, partial [Clostridium perfringens]|nr:hypothetical protein [Clostridium perfringens]